MFEDFWVSCEDIMVKFAHTLMTKTRDVSSRSFSVKRQIIFDLEGHKIFMPIIAIIPWKLPQKAVRKEMGVVVC